MEKIDLSNNHRRSIGSSLFIVEELLMEMEYVLNHPTKGVFSKMTVDVSTETRSASVATIAKAREFLEELSLKYDLPANSFSMSRFLDSRKSKIWEVLRDTNSKRLRAYGKFPQEHSSEFDSDIQKLLDITSKIEIQ